MSSCAIGPGPCSPFFALVTTAAGFFWRNAKGRLRVEWAIALVRTGLFDSFLPFFFVTSVANQVGG